MIIISLADLHGRTDNLPQLAGELAAANMVLLAGDITHFGRAPQAAAILSAVRSYQPQVLAVAGNCDLPEVTTYLEQEGVSLHGRHVISQGVAFLGIGMSHPLPGAAPGETMEQTLARLLPQAAAGIPAGTPTVLLTHQPPYDTRADLAFDGSHVGSRAIRDFIIAARPLLCLTGHIHEGRGEDRIGSTLVLNPGPLRQGGYAWAEITPAGCRGEIRTIL